MGLKIRYSELAEVQKEEWKRSGDKKAMTRIELLMKDILKTPFTGIGKPEPL